MSTKISQLTSAVDVTANDLIQIVDVEDGVMAPSGTNKKATASLLANQLVPLISDNAIAGSKIADSGITSAKIANGTIVDADINASAAIAGTKVSPNFGSQNISTTGTISANAGSVISGSSSGNALLITQTGSGNALVVEDSTNPDSTPFVVNTIGTVISGINSSQFAIGTQTSRFQIHAFSQEASYNATSWSTGTNVGPSVILSRSEGGVIGTHSIVAAPDQLGRISFAGSDGEKFVEGARIESIVDGTPGVDNIPGRLVFSTTPDGSNTPTERMRITSSGGVGIGASAADSCLLQLTSTTRGFRPPSMTTTQRDDIATPAAGLMIYNNTTNKLNFYNGSAWEAVTSAV